MSDPMRCPCCDKPMELPPHKHGERWTADQITWMQRGQGLISQKAMARLFGVSDDTIRRLLYEARNAQ